MEILSPAKINLFLHITEKRADGYHDLVTLMCCIDLFDTVSLNFGVKNTKVSCAHPNVPEDETNLAYIAARVFQKTLKNNEGVRIYIEKKIPVAAGLGGGSSNAGAVLLGLNRYYGYPFSRDELVSMGLSIGADVPFFILKKPAIASGIGEKLTGYHGLKKRKVLLVFPGFGVSTAEVYKSLNLGLTKCKKKLKHLFFDKHTFDPRYHLCNDLESVVISKYPIISVAKDALLDSGAIGALVSGSGPTVFGLFPDSDKAREAYHILLKHDQWQLYLSDMMIDAKLMVQDL
jgi:4-diphosphocytidyl-2-C-methyl-D-erythritol kinase